MRAQAVQSGGVFELSLTSDSSYAHPVRDVDLLCAFSDPNGNVDTVRGFWDGGATYRVRYAPFVAGGWSYRTISSDPENAGLDHREGSFVVRDYTGTDVYRRRGRLRVSENHRYLCYADGTPFFYLGEAAWECSWKSTIDEVRMFASDRKRKHFTVVQLVAGSHFYLPDTGVTNRSGASLFLKHDFSLPNPKFFAYLDSVVQVFNDSGLIVTMVPLWGMMAAPYRDNHFHARYVSQDEAEYIYRYVGARYAASHVMWFVTGDVPFDTDERRDYWRHAAAALRSATGPRQVISIHPNGWNASYNGFSGDTWLDFDDYQSSHSISGLYTIRGAEDGWQLQPPRPVLNGECLYEDIYDDLWQEGDTVRPRPNRAQDADVRRAAWSSVLSGSIVGVAYGTNGVFQWSEPWQLDFQYPRFTVSEAIHLPGSTQMGIMRDLLERWNWHETASMEQSSVVTVAGGNGTLPCLASAERVLAYFPPGTSAALIKPGLSGPIDIHWIRTWNGESWGTTRATLAGGTDNVLLAPPDPALDWLCVLEPANTSSAGGLPDSLPTCRIFDIGGNRAKVVLISAMPVGTVVESWSVLGDLVDRAYLDSRNGASECSVSVSRGGFIVVRTPSPKGNGTGMIVRMF